MWRQDIIRRLCPLYGPCCTVNSFDLETTRSASLYRNNDCIRGRHKRRTVMDQQVVTAKLRRLVHGGLPGNALERLRSVRGYRRMLSVVGVAGPWGGERLAGVDAEHFI